jgi:hypothetical protein
MASDYTEDSDGKKRKRGKDRAAWYRICDEYFPTRAKWCVPGGVFGWYAEGVGPLLPNHIRPRRAVVVYSADPDTLEEHPDPGNPDHYVPIVLVHPPLPPSSMFLPSYSSSPQVGEAPVHLRDDQYLKLRELACCCDIYVNHMGEVCVRSIDKDPPRGGMVFAATDWHDNATRIVDDYPVFQRVRGVCAKIFFDPSVPHHVNNPTGIERAVLDVTQSLKSTFFDSCSSPSSSASCSHGATSETGSPLDRLLEKRRRLNDELGSIERQHLLFKTCKPHRQTYETVIAKNLELISFYSSSIDAIPRSEEVLQTTQQLNQEMILQLVEMNKKLQTQLDWLTAQSSMSAKLYKEEKERVENELEKVKQKLKKIKK